MYAFNPDNPDRGLPLQRLSDVVRDYMNEYSVPLQVAVMKVHERLASMPDLRLYLDRPGKWGEPIASTHPWRTGHPGEAGYFKPLGKSAGYTRPAAVGTITVGPSVWVNPKPAIAELIGVPGALALMLETWGPAQDEAVALDGGDLAGLAMLASDAAELFGFRSAAVASPAPTAAAQTLHQVWPAPLQTTGPAPVQASVRAPTGPAHHPATRKEWTEADKAEMRADRHERGMTDTTIGKKWDISRQRVTQLIGSKTDERRRKGQRQA